MAKVDIHETTKAARDMQEQYFRTTDRLPGEMWYWAALVSIITSAMLFLSGKRDWGLFVGQWPPAFLLFGIFHKLLRPGRSQF
ncbi:hypothetical protein [Thermogemmatispora tikiterensis]|uniref:Uncharacterized protein n=1 Tax=Thermogemmatispora tikiterensis TaxID=1825093 RepID=A0A328VLN5_9CHLR|nr:hypothetical protein [Thermogemmatispora tikiterensis]RAQ98079.1 hypothetical protein A4R35_21240 [Thermogemmatispora tikiterensis]